MLREPKNVGAIAWVLLWQAACFAHMLWIALQVRELYAGLGLSELPLVARLASSPAALASSFMLVIPLIWALGRKYFKDRSWTIMLVSDVFAISGFVHALICPLGRITFGIH